VAAIGHDCFVASFANKSKGFLMTKDVTNFGRGKKKLVLFDQKLRLFDQNLCYLVKYLDFGEF
jgi:hypothetical protein